MLPLAAKTGSSFILCDSSSIFSFSVFASGLCFPTLALLSRSSKHFDSYCFVLFKWLQVNTLVRNVQISVTQ